MLDDTKNDETRFDGVHSIGKRNTSHAIRIRKKKTEKHFKGFFIGSQYNSKTIEKK